MGLLSLLWQRDTKSHPRQKALIPVLTEWMGFQVNNEPIFERKKQCDGKFTTWRFKFSAKHLCGRGSDLRFGNNSFLTRQAVVGGLQRKDN